MKRIITTIAVLAFLSSASSPAMENTAADSARVVRPWNITESFWESASSQKSYSDATLENAAVSDLRIRLTGLIPGLEITEIGGTLERNSSMGAVSLSSNAENVWNRGRSSVICIVDDIPVSLNQLRLDPNQIESVTLLTDVASKALFGPIASDGALYIKTKTGSYNTPMTVVADIESGIGFVDRWPEWVTGREYADLNNKARLASGKTALYSEEYIGSIVPGNAYDMKSPDVDYKSLMYNNSKPVTRFGVNVSGGADKLKYNFSLNGLGDNDIVKTGPADDYYKLNTTMNVTAKFGRWVEACAAFTGLVSFYRSSGIDFDSYRNTPSIAFPIAFDAESGSGPTLADPSMFGKTIYAVSKQFPDNPYAELVEGAGSVTKHRSGMFNLGLNIDFSWLLPGLKSRTFANLNTYFNQQIGKKSDYFAYYWERNAAEDAALEATDHIGEKDSEKSVQSNFSYQGLYIYERLDYDFARAGHKINAGVTYYMSNDAHKSNSYAERTQNFIGNVNWSYQGKYIAQIVADYSGTTRFDADHRWAFLPTASVAWVPTKEDFLSDVGWLDNLKIHAQAGLIGDIDVFGTHYQYQARYSSSEGRGFGQYASNPWFGTTVKRKANVTKLTRLDNHDLTWAKMFQYEAGFDARLLGCLDLSVNLYAMKELGLITNTSLIYPDSFGIDGIELYQNYNESTTKGIELSINYGKSWGNHHFGAGGWVSTGKQTLGKLADDLYIYDWQKKTGTRSDAYWGFECLGKFQSESEIASSALYSSETVVGDLKYNDLNNDGSIDDNDKKVIGNTTPDLMYALNLEYGYKNFNISVVGTGRAFYQIPMTNGYFWSGWGDNGYSRFVADNIGGDYPVLSYDKNPNNFVASDFWLRDGGWFKIQNIDLSYTVDMKNFSKIDKMVFSIRGNNLATFTKIDYVDPESISAGVSNKPLFRTVTAAVKIKF